MHCTQNFFARKAVRSYVDLPHFGKDGFSFRCAPPSERDRRPTSGELQLDSFVNSACDDGYLAAKTAHCLSPSVLRDMHPDACYLAYRLVLAVEQGDG
ncbi:hypothetical protein [Paraburkholderia sp. MM5477-R1]|uniref:hypothetical protein n=1 Tax=Paraburkholderia sp. MM5477-R1 TaxID=2991062 RepID=UPI003D1EC8C0